MKTYTIVDGDRVVEVDELPKIKDGFIWFDGVLREVNEVHVSETGKQIELLP